MLLRRLGYSKAFHSTAIMNYKRAPTIVLEPPVRRGMQQLDRDQFTISVPVIVARVRAPNTTDFVKGKAKE